MATFTLTDRVRAWSQPFLAPIADFLARLRVSPNTVTILGFLGCVAVGVVLALGYLRLGGLMLAIFGPLDAVDGLLARRSGQQTKFGAFLDSTLDRYSEIVIFGGLLYFLLETNQSLAVLLLFFALSGSLMVSYTRARAEALGFECKVGLLTRFERLLLLTGGLITGWLLPVLAILAVFTNLTALQRIIHVRKQAKS
ncbi:MAG: CDP-alcohol phosphatidyltransferase family protein [Thermodesulfobacteria bacterium]|nr:CDP-alcohol phosphatidyltransferase family protein [Thermodesulfobacteriota bacterium]